MGSVTGRDDAGVTKMGNSRMGRDWRIARMRERGRKSFSVHVEVREVEISIGRIAVVGEVGGKRLKVEILQGEVCEEVWDGRWGEVYGLTGKEGGAENCRQVEGERGRQWGGMVEG